VDPTTRRLTNRHSAFAAVSSFVLQPIPAADELFVVPVHYRLAWKIARARQAKVLGLPWKQLHEIIWYGAGARLVANFTLGLVPVAGAFSNAVTAMALTEYLGRYLDDVLEHPDRPAPPVSMAELKRLMAEAVKRKGTAPAAASAAGEAPAASAEASS
jgi:uncharacterized protein (DUF697 family)